MKNTLKNSLILLLLLFVFSCDQENNFQDPVVPSQSDGHDGLTNSKSLDLFALHLAKAAEDQNFRAFLKDKALEQIDGDYDILYHVVKNEMIDEKRTVEEAIFEGMENSKEVKTTLHSLPLLTLFIPELPQFSASSWDVVNDEVPLVAIDNGNENKFFDGIGNSEIIPAKYAPAFPTIVLKENERFKLSNGSPSSDARIQSNEFEYELISPAFAKKEESSTPENARTITNGLIDPVIRDAYQKTLGCSGCTHRDYIYYKIDNPSGEGSFDNRFVEAITAIKFNSTAGLAVASNNWTEGNLELHFTAIFIGGDNSISQLKKVVSVAANDLQNITYGTECSGWWIFRRCWTVIRSREVKELVFDDPIEFEGWRMNEYGNKWLFTAFEYDPSTTIEKNYSLTTVKGTNFKLTGEGTIKKIIKLGAEFGGSSTTTKTNSTKVTYTTTSNDLGQAILNWRSPILTSFSGSSAATYTMNTGTVQLSMETVRTTEFLYPPINAYAYHDGDEELTVTWDAVPSAVEYKIYTEYEGIGTGFKWYRTVKSNQYSRELKAKFRSTYRLKISAVDLYGNETSLVEPRYSWK